MENGAERTGQIAVIAAVACCTIGIISGLFAVYQLAVAGIVLAALVVCYVAQFGNTSTQYGLILYMLTLGLILQTTLLSPYLVGTDIHAEFYHTLQAAVYGWDTSLFHAYNTSFTLVPLLALIADTEYLYVAYKLCIPAVFALVPVFAFNLFRSSFNDRVAFVSAFVVVAVPTFVTETVGMARQMIAMPFMVLVFAIVAMGRLHNWRWWIAAAVFGTVASLSHYTIGVIMCFILAVAAVVLLAYSLIFRIHTSTRRLVLLCMVLMLAWWGYYYNVGQGTIVYQTYAKVAHMMPSIPPLHGTVEAVIPSSESFPVVAPPTVESVAVESVYLDGYEHGMRMALGYGITQENPQARVFWFIQYALQLLLLGGIAYVLYRHRRLNVRPEYVALAVAVCAMLAMCITLPGFSALLNATRFYLFGMTVLAPCIVLAAMRLLGSLMRVVLLVLMPYLVFASGLVFEAAQIADLTHMTVPYSIALTNHRLDLGGSQTEADNVVRQYIISHETYPVYGDFYTAEFMSDVTDVANLTITWAQMPIASVTLDSSYIFVRERNARDGVWVSWAGVGMREHESLGSNAIGKELAQRPVVFQCGGAVLYGPRL